MRCKNCSKYNHTAKFCKNEKICPNCGNPHHLNEENNEICQQPKKCMNCVSSNLSPYNHPAFDRKCPIYIKEYELQSIKATYKIDHRAAKIIYNERHQHNPFSYASVTSQHNHTQPIAQTNTSNTKPPCPTILNPAAKKRIITSYSDQSESDLDHTHAKEGPNTKIMILPKNASKRTLQQ